MVAEEKTSYGWGRNYRYCVAGMGRVGATMLTRYLTQKFGVSKVTGVHARDFVEFDGKVVFLFGNPYNTVVSFIKMSRLRKTHFEHFGVPYNSDDFHGLNESYMYRRKFLYGDILGIEKTFDDWYRKHEFSLATIRYETLWSNIKNLEEYLGVGMDDFPKYVQRRTNWKELRDHDKELLVKTYGRLYNKIGSAKDFKVWT